MNNTRRISFIGRRAAPGHKGSLALFRRNSQAINGQLTGMWWRVSRAVAAVCGEGAGYG